MLSRYCYVCDRQSIFDRPKLNHVLHLLLSLLTLGLWIPIWAILALNQLTVRRHCVHCGQHIMRKPPSWTQEEADIA